MTGDDLRAIAETLDPDANKLSVSRLNTAADKLDAGNVVEAHVEVADVVTSMAVSGSLVPETLFDAEEALAEARIASYGSIAHPVEQSAPNLTGGW